MALLALVRVLSRAHRHDAVGRILTQQVGLIVEPGAGDHNLLVASNARQRQVVALHARYAWSALVSPGRRLLPSSTFSFAA